MKKAILVTVFASTISSAAAADYFGVFAGGTLGGFGGGLHFQQDISSTSSVRYALTGLGLSNGFFNIGGEVAYLNSLPGNDFGALQPYYGAGLGLGFAMGSGASAIALYPHVLGGLRYNLPASPLSIFGELNAGPQFVFASAAGTSGMGIDLGFGGRLGINYRL